MLHSDWFPSPALLFGNDTNPALPKHIGSIDPTCNVADVVRGERFTRYVVLTPSLCCRNDYTKTCFHMFANVSIAFTFLIHSLRETIFVALLSHTHTRLSSTDETQTSIIP